MTTLYHGTAWSFDRFADYPLFFTPDLAAAAAYAFDCRVYPAPAQPGVPVVLAVEVDTSAFLELSREQFLTLMEIDDEANDSGCWEALLNYVCEREHEGYAGICVRGVRDYCGGSGPGRQVRAYDQVIVLHPAQLPILRRIEVSEADLVLLE